MTLQNCERLLAHYTETGNDKAAEDMKANIEQKTALMIKYGLVVEKEKVKKSN